MKIIPLRYSVTAVLVIAVLFFLSFTPQTHALLGEIITGAIWENSDTHGYYIEVENYDEKTQPVYNVRSGKLYSDSIYGTNHKGLPVLDFTVEATEVLANALIQEDSPYNNGERYEHGKALNEWWFPFTPPQTEFWTATGPGGGTQVYEPEPGDPGAIRGNYMYYPQTDIWDFTPSPNGFARQHPIALFYTLVPLGEDNRYKSDGTLYDPQTTGMGDYTYDRQKDSIKTKEYGYLKANMAYGADRPAFKDFWSLVNGDLPGNGMPFTIVTEKIHFSLNYPADNLIDSWVDFMGSIFGDEDPEFILRFIERGVLGPNDHSTMRVTLRGGTIISKLNFENGQLSKEHFIGQFGPAPDAAADPSQVKIIGTLVSLGKTDLEYDSKKLPNVPTQLVSAWGDTKDDTKKKMNDETSAVIFNPAHLPDVIDPKMEPLSPAAVFHIRN